jgi:hypothetical protein
VGGGVQTGSTWHRCHLLSYCASPGWLWGWRIIRWNEDWQGKPKYSEKTCPAPLCPPQIPLDHTRLFMPLCVLFICFVFEAQGSQEEWNGWSVNYIYIYHNYIWEKWELTTKFVRKPDGSGGFKRILEDIIKLDLNNLECRCGLDSASSGLNLWIRFEPSGSIKGGAEFLDQLYVYQLCCMLYIMATRISTFQLIQHRLNNLGMKFWACILDLHCFKRCSIYRYSLKLETRCFSSSPGRLHHSIWWRYQFLPLNNWNNWSVLLTALICTWHAVSPYRTAKSTQLFTITRKTTRSC